MKLDIEDGVAKRHKLRRCLHKSRGIARENLCDKGFRLTGRPLLVDGWSTISGQQRPKSNTIRTSGMKPSTPSPFDRLRTRHPL
jgi:hypothetical protein